MGSVRSQWPFWSVHHWWYLVNEIPSGCFIKVWSHHDLEIDLYPLKYNHFTSSLSPSECLGQNLEQKKLESNIKSHLHWSINIITLSLRATSCYFPFFLSVVYFHRVVIYHLYGSFWQHCLALCWLVHFQRRTTHSQLSDELACLCMLVLCDVRATMADDDFC